MNTNWIRIIRLSGSKHFLCLKFSQSKFKYLQEKYQKIKNNKKKKVASNMLKKVQKNANNQIRILIIALYSSELMIRLLSLCVLHNYNTFRVCQTRMTILHKILLQSGLAQYIMKIIKTNQGQRILLQETSYTKLLRLMRNVNIMRNQIWRSTQR